MLTFKAILIITIIAVIVSIVRTFLKTGVSPMPSSIKARSVMVSSAEIEREGDIVDLGSGWGTLVASFAGKYPERRVIGYEMSYVPYIFSLALRKILGRENISLYHRDYMEADLSGAALLVCYLSPDGMRLLREKLEEDELGNVVIISNTFAFPSCEPYRVVRLNNMYKTPIYTYRFFEKHSGNLMSHEVPE